MSIYIAHSQKISNALSTSRQYFAKKCVFNWRLKCWDSVLDREDCLAANSRLTDPQQQNTDDQNCSGGMIAQNDQLPLTGRPQILTASNVGRWCAAVPQEQRSHAIPWRHRYISTESLNCTRSVTSSQWSSSCSSRDKPPTNFREREFIRTKHAGAHYTTHNSEQHSNI